MIQRIQTVWLLLATLTASALFYTDVYHAEIITGAVTTVLAFKVASHFPSLLLAVVVILIPFVSIFLFKNRKKQRNLIWLGVLAALAFISVNLWRISHFTTGTVPEPGGTYQVGSILPVLVLIFLFLAIRGINKDEKLVRSLDRLR